MNYIITANHCRNEFIVELENLVKLFTLNQSSKYLFFSMTGSHGDQISNFVDFLEKNSKFTHLTLHFPCESPDYWKFINSFLQLSKIRYQIPKFSVIDSGHTIHHCDHFCYNNFINEMHKSWEPVSAEQRNFFLACLNRILKPHRIKLVEKLLTLKNEQIIVTAGNYENFKNIQSSFKVPMTAPDEIATKINSFDQMRNIPLSVRSCIFNLVTESSYEDIGDNFSTWNRIMITEKTTKPYKLFQIPLFLAPAGHVELQRVLGFDVFDDLIDHSYDLCQDPNERIALIYNVVKKIQSQPIDFWKSKLNTHWHRLEKNYQNCNFVKKHLDDMCIQKFNFWAK
jgi:hypothetical protein